MDNAASVKAFFPFGARPRSGTSRLLADEARRFLLGTALRARRGPVSLAIWFHAVLESQARWIICLGVPASSASPVAFALAWLCGLHASRFALLFFAAAPFISFRSLAYCSIRGAAFRRRSCVGYGIFDAVHHDQCCAEMRSREPTLLSSRLLFCIDPQSTASSRRDALRFPPLLVV
ncbi:hypothetical protein HPB51_019218 [Rhipicephalus microplus]|uniref:Uncharacterized protein n=1 Tax=Rhipicephalus microplus TaxID=6941 RepID=A0A9J6DB72_RHIMP|nr:hypothetical protein HPB51_019218 [Rhipicephalus microplus]